MCSIRRFFGSHLKEGRRTGVLVACALLMACARAPAGIGLFTDDLEKTHAKLKDEGFLFEVERTEGLAGARIERWMYGKTQVLIHHLPQASAFVVQRWWVGGPPSPRATESTLASQRGIFARHADTQVYFAEDLAYAELTSPVLTSMASMSPAELRAAFSAWLDALPAGPEGPLLIAAVGGLPRAALLGAAAREGDELASGRPDLPTPGSGPLDAFSVQLSLSPAGLPETTRLEALAEVLGEPQNGPLTSDLKKTGARWVEVETRANPDGARLTVRFGPLHAVSPPAATHAVNEALGVVAEGKIEEAAFRRAIRRLRGRRARRWARAEGRARMMAETVWTFGQLAAVGQQDAAAKDLKRKQLRASAKALLALSPQVRP